MPADTLGVGYAMQNAETSILADKLTYLGGSAMKKRFGWAAMVLLVALSVVDSNVSARAEEQISEFDVHVGDAFIFGTSPFRLGDVSLASTGESIEVIFTGRIDVVDQGATGMGAFQHRDNSGQVSDFGTFKAKHLISF